MKLSAWAKKMGISYLAAYKMFRAGKLPCRSLRLPTGTIIVLDDEPTPGSKKVALYARVSSHDQKADLERQMGRLRDYASSQGLVVAEEVAEIASGLNGNRKGLSKLLRDPSITTIIVEHRDRLSRFGVEFIEASLAASKREAIVLNESEFKDDLVRDFVDVVTSMCARIYGRRSAKNRAKRALEAAAV